MSGSSSRRGASCTVTKGSGPYASRSGMIVSFIASKGFTDMRERIAVTYRSDPFDFQAIKTFDVEEGASLADIVREVTDDPDQFFVCINGEPIDPAWYHLVRPRIGSKIPTIVTLHPVPHGSVKEVL